MNEDEKPVEGTATIPFRYFTTEELRSFVSAFGWDEEFVEMLVKKITHE